MKMLRLQKCKIDDYWYHIDVFAANYILQMSVDKVNSKRLQLTFQRSSPYTATYVTDTDFADGIALISQSVDNAQSLLQPFEQAANCVELYVSETKTEYLK